MLGTGEQLFIYNVDLESNCKMPRLHLASDNEETAVLKKYKLINYTCTHMLYGPQPLPTESRIYCLSCSPCIEF